MDLHRLSATAWKYILLFCLLYYNCQLSAYAGEEEPGGIIKGKVITMDNKPAAGVTIQLRGTKKATLTEEDGSFTLGNLHSGTYEMEISLVGFTTIRQTVVVEENKTVPVHIELKASSGQLEEVIVTNGANRFAKKETGDIARLPLKNLENPQVYNIVPKELMQEQIVTDYNSAFKNIPGAGVPVVYNQGRSQLLSRGFSTANLVRNGVGGFVYNNIDPANLERIEVIKGPSATLFGSTLTSFGGLFNRVTKKPVDGFKGEVAYSGGSWELNRLTADLNTPLNKDHSALFRINGAVHSERSFQDAGFTRSFMIAPAFSYKLNDRLTVLLDVEFSNYKATSPFRLAPSTSGKARSIQDLGINYNLSFANNSVSYTTRQLNVFGQINYKMDDNWSSQTIFSRTQSSTNGYTVQLTGLTDSTLRQTVTQQDFPYYGTDIQQNFIGDFQLGGLRNRLVAGLDFFHLSSFRTDASVNMPALNFKKPGSAYTSFNGDKIASLFATATFQAIQPNREYTYSAYVSDVVNVTDRLLVMASLRLDRYDSKGTYYSYYDSTAGAFSQTALSPKLGLVYQLIKDRVSLFANYMNGFQNVNGSDYGGNTFKPQQANQSEGGLKFDIWQHKLNATFTYYNISVTNTTRDDTAHAGYSIQDGTQLSKGFEGELIANPLPGFNIVTGYAYNNSRYDKANKSIQGLRPSTAGPDKMANVWLSYRLTKGRGKGLGLGLGANYGSASTQSNTSTFIFTIPSYTVLDATLFYDQPLFRIGIKVDNLTNEKYWSYRLAPQNPTRLTANIAVKF